MAFLQNTWYLAAWDNEITQALFARDIIGESVLMYRKQDGTPVALSNRCPHRYAPLSMGKLKGDVVECGYHGLRFDGTGQCVLNPHPGGNGPIPRDAKVTQYPLVEKYGALWIWMGQKAPDESLLPDLSWLEEPAVPAGQIGFRRRDTREIRDMCPVNAHYELIVDNVLDLTHLPYLHEGGLGNQPQYLYREKVENVQEGNTFWCKRSSQEVEASPDFQHFNPRLAEFKCDKTNAVRWNAPGHVVIVPTYWKSGTDKEHMTCLYISTMLTPASEGKTWQFWSLARNFALENDDLDLMMRKAAAVGLEREDVDIIETQWRYMGTPDIFSLNLAALPGDITPNRVRRALASMIAKEQAEMQGQAQPAPVSSQRAERLTA